ncbi:MAG: hypothetical protein KJO49_05710 [Bacteroidia bacterium]|nr:hypothetical protein [Bacteroidia bacterium]MBT8267643.1 hypothetical protein [Bacteroidia bacterium]NNF81179.1 hypothetical protein [Flavobacteriaceae bacterium]NNL78964.1 hypothetical protein [Flavobacteriaceae bacterium]
MKTDKEVLRKGLKYLAITVLMMFAGPSLLYVAFSNPEKPLYIPLLIVSLLICAGAIIMGFKGIRTIMDSMFKSNLED